MPALLDEVAGLSGGVVVAGRPRFGDPTRSNAASRAAARSSGDLGDGSIVPSPELAESSRVRRIGPGLPGIAERGVERGSFVFTRIPDPNLSSSRPGCSARRLPTSCCASRRVRPPQSLASESLPRSLPLVPIELVSNPPPVPLPALFCRAHHRSSSFSLGASNVGSMGSTTSMNTLSDMPPKSRRVSKCQGTRRAENIIGRRAPSSGASPFSRVAAVGRAEYGARRC